MAYNRGERPDSPMKRRGGRRRKKVCVFCAKHQRALTVAIKRARHMSMMPYIQD